MDRQLIKIGTRCYTRHGSAKVTGIELCKDDKYGIPIDRIWADLKDRCVFDFDNGHWAYGVTVTPYDLGER